jgi:predicted Zn-dependent protease
MDELRNYFYDLADALQSMLRPGEVFTASLSAENSDFARLNRNRVRQAGHVRQLVLSLDWIEGRRHASAKLDLSGGLDADRVLLEEQTVALRAQRAHLEEDPFLLYATGVHGSQTARGDGGIDAGAAVRDTIQAAEGLDLVGLWSSGSVVRGFANSFGQRNWYEASSFNLDWSAYLERDKAVKGAYAGFAWEPEALAARFEAARHELEVLGRPSRAIKPGEYRVYLAPAAIQELLTLLAWGGFGLKSHRTKQTSLIRMVEEGRRLHPGVTLWEHHAGGIAPPFTPSGHVKPEKVVLIESGRYRDCLTDPRSAKEYDQPVNAAMEYPQTLQLLPGSLDSGEVLPRLERGLYLNNLWYANFSDRNECRITGMTRFACFWVEDGRIVAPIEPMRFDDSLYRMFGENLLGLTRDAEFLFEANTYFSRSVASWSLPGALVEGMRFTL